MRLKTYQTETVEAAVRLAGIELGSNAVFLGSRKNDVGDDRTACYEVTFSVPDRDDGMSEEVRQPQVEPADPSGKPRSFHSPIVEARRGPKAARDTPAARGNPTTDAGLAARMGRTPPAHSKSDRVHWKKFVPQRLRFNLPDSTWQPEAASQADSTRHIKGDHPNEIAGAEANPQLPHAKPNGGVAISEPAGVRSASSPDQNNAHPAGAHPPRDSQPSGRNALVKPAMSPPLTQHGPSFAAPAAAAAAATQTAQIDAPAAQGSRPPGAASSPARSAVPSHAPPSREMIEDLSARIEELRQLVLVRLDSVPTFLPSGEVLSHPELVDVYKHLIHKEVDPVIAEQWVAGLRRAVEEGAGRERLDELLAQQLTALCRTSSDLGCRGSQPKIVALVGPSGAGKTITLAKLAIRYGWARQCRIHLLSVDQRRVGEAEPLESYAALLAAPFDVLDEIEALPGCLESLCRGQEGEHPELIFIDTPGYAPVEWPQARRLAECLAAQPAIDTHLVVSLNTRGGDLERMVDQYQVFKPAKLLVTKLDETDACGPIVNQAVRTKLPLSFFGTGQQVPEDLVPATNPYLLNLLLKRQH